MQLVRACLVTALVCCAATAAADEVVMTTAGGQISVSPPPGWNQDVAHAQLTSADGQVSCVVDARPAKGPDLDAALHERLAEESQGGQDTTAPESATFMNHPARLGIARMGAGTSATHGALVVLSIDPQSKQVWAFACHGPLDRFADEARPLAETIASVHVVDAAQAAALGAPAAVDPYVIDDPSLGLRVKAMRKWRLGIAGDEYQLERTGDGAACIVAVRRVTSAAGEKALAVLGKASATQFAGEPARVAERQSTVAQERSYLIGKGPSRVLIELRLAQRGDPRALDARVFELEQAFVAVPAPTTGSVVTLLGGVRVAPTAGWKRTGMGPGRANYRGARGVEVTVDAWPTTLTGAPPASVECPGAKATTGVIAGGREVRKTQCVQGKVTTVMITATADGGQGRVWIVVKGPSANDAALAAAAEFVAYISFVGSEGTK